MTTFSRRVYTELSVCIILKLLQRYSYRVDIQKVKSGQICSCLKIWSNLRTIFYLRGRVMLNKLWLGKLVARLTLPLVSVCIYCVGDIDGCMKVHFFTIKCFVRYKENVLLNQMYLFVLRFLYFIYI